MLPAPVLLVAALALAALVPRQWLGGADCNRNGLPDDLDISPRFEVTSPVFFSAGSLPFFVTALDVDRDGHTDLVTAEYANAGEGSILHGRGDATFRSASSFPTGGGTRDVAAGDLDRDGFTDLVAADSGFVGGASGLSVLMSTPDGGYRLSRLSAGVQCTSVAPGDLDADGDLDLAMVSLGGVVSIWRNAGDGTFPRRSQITVGAGAHRIIAADLDTDGDLELATADSWDSRISVLRNSGAGAFGPAERFAAESPVFLTAADADGDALPDLAVVGSSSREGAAEVEVRWNDGRGAFPAGTRFSIEGAPNSVTLADIDADGSLDLAIPGFESGALIVHRGDSSRSFLPALLVPIGVRAAHAAAGDVD